MISLISERRLLKSGFTVMELGHQDVGPSTDAAGTFGWEDFVTNGHASAIYARLGCPNYESIDPAAGGAHNFDIERNLSETYGFDTRFDLVTNFGVSARLFDQSTVFANIHTLTLAGGVMLHVVPTTAAQGEALFAYTGHVFKALAESNGYRIDGLFFAIDGQLQPWSLAPPAAGEAGRVLCAAMTKIEERPFVAPSGDAFYIAGRDEAAQSAIGIVRGEDAQTSGSASLGQWDGSYDPFDYHRRKAILALSEAVAAVYGYDVAGDIAEFGTQTGETAAGLARAIASCDSRMTVSIRAHSHAPRRLCLLDSFEGLPSVPPGSVDAVSYHVRDGVWAAGELRGLTPEELHAKVAAFMPANRIEVYPGWFSDTVPTLSPSQRFALLHVDCDLYSSTMDVLDGLFSRGMVSRGAYVFFDDWNCNRADPAFGERRAWRELVEKYSIEASDEGSYGIFARRFVVHAYRGAPPASVSHRDPSEIDIYIAPSPT